MISQGQRATLAHLPGLDGEKCPEQDDHTLDGYEGPHKVQAVLRVTPLELIEVLEVTDLTRLGTEFKVKKKSLILMTVNGAPEVCLKIIYQYVDYKLYIFI